MNQKQFLETVLASGDHYCLFDSRTKTNNFYITLDELLEHADRIKNRSNLFFGLSTYGTPDTRIGTNTKNMKCFFLDMDSKDVGSKAIALERVQTLCKIYKLPKPIIVDSGNGMHFYWPLTEAVDTQTKWKPVAEHFKKICAENKVGADPKVTADSARILRLPETFNLKDADNPKLVSIVSSKVNKLSYEDFCGRIGYKNENPLLDASKVSGLFDSCNSNLLGNYKSTFADIIKENGCNFLREAIANNAMLSEPEWYSSLSIAQHCEDSDVYIIKLSEDHPDFSPEKARKKAAGAEYPHSCDTLRETHPEWCEGCPHYNKIKSPIVLGRHVVEAKIDGEHVVVEPKRLEGKKKVIDAYKIPLPPMGFSIGKEGGVYRQVTDEDGEKVNELVTEHTFYGVDRVYDREEKEESLIVRLHLANDEPRTEIIPNSSIASAEKLRDKLANIGLFPVSNKHMRDYIMSWVRKFQQSGTARSPLKQFGWVTDDMEEFVVGENLITKNGIDVALPSKQTAPFVPAFDKRGSYDKWKEKLKIWEDPKFVQHQVAVGVGVGSILMPNAEVAGALLHMYTTESGVAKTAATRVIMSMWGDPKELTIKHKDTNATKFNRFEVYHNLPVCIDEITNILSKEASDLIYDISDGTQRKRMSGTSNAERPTGRPWQLLGISTSNFTLLGRINSADGKSFPEAEAQRVLEMHVERVYPEDEEPPELDDFMGTFEQNFGFAGPDLVEYIIHNKEAVRAMQKKIVDAVRAKAKFGMKNRFQKELVVKCLQGLSVMKMAGIFSCDIKEVFKYIIGDLLPFNRQKLEGMRKTAEDLVSDFLSENISNVLIVADDEVATVGGMPVSPAEKSARVAIDARYESKTGLLYLRCASFNDWCAKKQIDSVMLFKDMLNSHNAERKKTRLGTGTSLVINSVWCYKLDWSQPINAETDEQDSDAE